MIRQRAAAAAVFAIVLAPLSVQAAEKTVVLNVEKEDCTLCAPIVKRTLARIAGVHAVQVTEASAMAPAIASVTFDDTATNVPAPIAATAKAGYPSTPKG